MRKRINMAPKIWSKTVLFVLASTFTVFTIVSFLLPEGTMIKTEVVDLKAETISLEEGFGYQIWHGKNLLIRQENIPGLSGDITFTNRQEAILIAKKVVHRLKNSQNPEITAQDLKNLNITIPEH